MLGRSTIYNPFSDGGRGSAGWDGSAFLTFVRVVRPALVGIAIQLGMEVPGPPDPKIGVPIALPLVGFSEP